MCLVRTALVRLIRLHHAKASPKSGRDGKLHNITGLLHVAVMHFASTYKLCNYQSASIGVLHVKHPNSTNGHKVCRCKRLLQMPSVP